MFCSKFINILLNFSSFENLRGMWDCHENIVLCIFYLHGILSRPITDIYSTSLRGCIKVVGPGGSTCKKIARPDANKCYRYQFRMDSSTGIRKRNVTIYTSSFKIIFQSLPFFTWAVTAYPHKSMKPSLKRVGVPYLRTAFLRTATL